MEVKKSLFEKLDFGKFSMLLVPDPLSQYESGSRKAKSMRIRMHNMATNLDVKDLVAGHDEVAEADDGPLPDRQARGAQLRLQRLQQVRVELHQQSAKPE